MQDEKLKSSRTKRKHKKQDERLNQAGKYQVEENSTSERIKKLKFQEAKLKLEERYVRSRDERFKSFTGHKGKIQQS